MMQKEFEEFAKLWCYDLTTDENGFYENVTTQRVYDSFYWGWITSRKSLEGARILDEDIREKLKEDLELHIRVWRECANKEEVKALRGAISYYSTPSEDAEYEDEFQKMLQTHKVDLSDENYCK